MNRRSLVAAMIAGLLWSGSLKAQTAVTWDGGDGDWNDLNWNGGQDIETLTGRANGTRGGHLITIGDGSLVTYDPNYDTGNDDNLDIRFDNGYARLTITEGATLHMNSATSPPPPDDFTDGYWMTVDADLTVDGGTLRRTFSGSQNSGGVLLFGSWNAGGSTETNYTGPIVVNVKNGGRIENDGVMLFGYEDEYGPDVRVNMRIDGGHLDLTGGSNEPLGDLLWENDLVITSTDPAALNADGEVANFQANINFVGSGGGSITVDEDGIANPHLDAANIWQNITTKVSYQDLWDRDLLKAHGLSARSGRDFNNYFTVTGTPGSADYTLTKKTATQVVWDGGDGDWNDLNWNGDQDIAALTGRANGSRGGHEIVIGGGATVTYDPNYDTGNDDNLDMRHDEGYSKLTIKEGATLHMNSATSPPPPDDFTDGYWMTLDADTELDGGTIRRTFSGSQNSGGVLLFGSWNARTGQEINVDLKNGGRIENDGVLLFGYEDEMSSDVTVKMTINDGHLDLTGGSNEPLGDLLWENDLVITTHDPAAINDSGEVSNFHASINFTGPGTITVDEDGIANPHLDAANIWQDITTKITYEDLWNRGLLQANGLSGLDGAVFADYFSVTGSSDSENYTLMSLLGGSLLVGDMNGDGAVNFGDLTPFVLALTDIPAYEEMFPGLDRVGLCDVSGDGMCNFGDLTPMANLLTGGPGSGSAVPEPASATLCLVAVLFGTGLADRRRRRS